MKRRKIRRGLNHSVATTVTNPWHASTLNTRTWLGTWVVGHDLQLAPIVKFVKTWIISTSKDRTRSWSSRNQSFFDRDISGRWCPQPQSFSGVDWGFWWDLDCNGALAVSGLGCLILLASFRQATATGFHDVYGSQIGAGWFIACLYKALSGARTCAASLRIVPTMARYHLKNSATRWQAACGRARSLQVWFGK